MNNVDSFLEIENAYKQNNTSLNDTIKSIFNKKKLDTAKKAFCFTELKPNCEPKFNSELYKSNLFLLSKSY